MLVILRQAWSAIYREALEWEKPWARVGIVWGQSNLQKIPGLAILLPKDVYHLKVQTKRQAMKQMLSDHRVGECLIVSLYP